MTQCPECRADDLRSLVKDEWACPGCDWECDGWVEALLRERDELRRRVQGPNGAELELVYRCTYCKCVISGRSATCGNMGCLGAAISAKRLVKPEEKP